VKRLALLLLLAGCGEAPVEASLALAPAELPICAPAASGTVTVDLCPDGTHALCRHHDFIDTACRREHCPTAACGVWAECVDTCP
jgi:hypothetical protein